MVDAPRSLSVSRLQQRQRRERLAGMVVLVAGAIACAIALALLTGPLPLVIGLAVLFGVVAIVNNPRVGLYALFFFAILLEQWGIFGLAPLTGQFPFYQTLAGAYGIPIPVSPLEMVLLLTLAVVVVPRIARRGVTLVWGPLFAPLLLFLACVVASVVYGMAGGGGAGPFDLRAAWEETRAFFYLAITYFLTCNLIRTRAQLTTLIWLFIAGIGVKSLQGIVRFIEVRSNGLQVEAITGHEDVVFFAAFVLLLAGLLFFGRNLDVAARRQIRLMIVVLPPLIFTLLVTNRRIGFVVLAVALGLVAVLLWRTRRDIFLRIAPVALVALSLYIPLFWNSTGTLGTPIRAVRSLVAPESQRDRQSNAWRELENTNIDYNIRSAPITGLGFGRPYFFIVAQPPLDATGFIYWRYIAHNAIYWVWMKMGLVGFVFFWNLIGSAVVLGLITFRQMRDGYLKVIALLGAGAVLMQVIFSYGDLGLTYARSMVFLGCMLGVLAVLRALPDPAADDSPNAQEAGAWGLGKARAQATQGARLG